MDIFLETDYRAVIKKIFLNRPQNGHGQASRLARKLDVNTTLVSQVLSGKKHFTEEQIAKVAKFLELNKKESCFFLLLAQFQRCQSEELRELLHFQIQQMQSEAKSIKGRVSPKAELNFSQQAVYYSTWYYSAIHTLVSIDGFKTIQSMADYLNLSAAIVQSTLETLMEYGLVIKREGLYASGPNSTYIPPDSPLILRHHQNWRQVAGQQVQQREPTDFYFTAPMSISKEDFKKFRGELTELLNKLYKLVEKSSPEDLVCLNIDFFGF